MRTLLCTALLAASCAGAPIDVDVPPLRTGARFTVDALAPDVTAAVDDERVARVVETTTTPAGTAIVLEAVAAGTATLLLSGSVEGASELVVRDVENVQPTLRGTFVFAGGSTIGGVRDTRLPFCTVFYGGEELLFGDGGVSVTGEDGVAIEEPGEGRLEDGCFDAVVTGTGSISIGAGDVSSFRIEAVDAADVTSARLNGPAQQNTHCIEAFAAAAPSLVVYGARGRFTVGDDDVGEGTCVSSRDTGDPVELRVRVPLQDGSTLETSVDAALDAATIVVE